MSDNEQTSSEEVTLEEIIDAYKGLFDKKGNITDQDEYDEAVDAIIENLSKTIVDDLDKDQQLGANNRLSKLRKTLENVKSGENGNKKAALKAIEEFQNSLEAEASGSAEDSEEDEGTSSEPDISVSEEPEESEEPVPKKKKKKASASSEEEGVTSSEDGARFTSEDYMDLVTLLSDLDRSSPRANDIGKSDKKKEDIFNMLSAAPTDLGGNSPFSEILERMGPKGMNLTPSMLIEAKKIIRDIIYDAPKKSDVFDPISVIAGTTEDFVFKNVREEDVELAKQYERQGKKVPKKYAATDSITLVFATKPTRKAIESENLGDKDPKEAFDEALAVYGDLLRSAHVGPKHRQQNEVISRLQDAVRRASDIYSFSKLKSTEGIALKAGDDSISMEDIRLMEFKLDRLKKNYYEAEGLSKRRPARKAKVSFFSNNFVEWINAETFGIYAKDVPGGYVAEIVLDSKNNPTTQRKERKSFWDKLQELASEHYNDYTNVKKELFDIKELRKRKGDTLLQRGVCLSAIDNSLPNMTLGMFSLLNGKQHTDITSNKTGCIIDVIKKKKGQAGGPDIYFAQSDAMKTTFAKKADLRYQKEKRAPRATTVANKTDMTVFDVLADYTKNKEEPFIPDRFSANYRMTIVSALKPNNQSDMYPDWLYDAVNNPNDLIPGTNVTGAKLVKALEAENVAFQTIKSYYTTAKDKYKKVVSKAASEQKRSDQAKEQKKANEEFVEFANKYKKKKKDQEASEEEEEEEEELPKKKKGKKGKKTTL